MKIISWNVNGIRAAIKKDFTTSVKEMDADILCIQETKISEDMLTDAIKKLNGYYEYFFSAEKKGYSGTAIFSKEQPLAVRQGIGHDVADSEGRVLTAEFKDFFVLSIYVVNVQPTLARLTIRQDFNDALLTYVKELEKEKPVIMTGDFNVAHKEIDLKNDKANRGKAGFTDEEREKFDNILAHNFVDTYRHFNPDTEKYSWWSYRANARVNNVGWRIDYVLVSKALLPQVKNTFILNDIHGSDHCPVGIVLK
jgi:exodeoxyribonuclease-3